MQTTLLLEMSANAFGERIALTSRGDEVSYADLYDRARAVGVWFKNAPIDVIAYVGLNTPAFPLALFASGFAAKPLAPLNYRLADSDLRAVLARTAPSLAIVDDEALGRVEGVPGVTLISCSEFLARAMHDAVPSDAMQPPDADDVAVLLFTSGTTGEPKAAVLRHRHLAAYVMSTVEFMGASEDEAALVSVPPYHIAGVSAVLTSTYLGRRIVQLEAFTAEQWVETAVRENVTHAMVVPTMLERVLDALDQTGEILPHLRHLSYGGGRMPAATIERAMTLLPHVDFVNAYGLTETSSTVAVLSPEDHRTAFASDDIAIRARLGSVGRPLPSLELEIRDTEGRALTSGQAGEIFVRGEQVSGEYLSHKVIADDGWLPTKDRGWLDSGGFLFVDGRLDDVIVRGGENISPGEIEDVLRGHPDVQDVAVIGLPDNKWGERVTAVVVSSRGASEAELQQWVRDRLRSSKTPEQIVFRPELPYNETGKVLRRVLRQELARDASVSTTG